jgi:CrcB protein
MKDFLVICLGASIGATSRYYLGLWCASKFGTTFPYGTFFINITGSLILGLFGTLALDRAALIAPELNLLVAIGIIGSYTTFSTFGFETIRLLEEGNWLLALGYVLGSILIGFLAVYLGVITARVLP